MKFIKGYRLYVRLSPSQTRRRLRGQGYGVRKVESAGKDRALIIHTATGHHRHELEMLFADCIEPPAEPDDIRAAEPETPSAETLGESSLKDI